jgi:hypothetical protein
VSNRAKKTNNEKTNIADIMLFYVENGVDYTNEYGDIHDRFYTSMESMFEAALKHICKSNLREDFYTRCEQIVEETSGIGWGFHDALSDMFYSYFNNHSLAPIMYEAQKGVDE